MTYFQVSNGQVSPVTAKPFTNSSAFQTLHALSQLGTTEEIKNIAGAVWNRYQDKYCVPAKILLSLLSCLVETEYSKSLKLYQAIIQKPIQPPFQESIIKVVDWRKAHPELVDRSDEIDNCESAMLTAFYISDPDSEKRPNPETQKFADAISKGWSLLTHPNVWIPEEPGRILGKTLSTILTQVCPGRLYNTLASSALAAHKRGSLNRDEQYALLWHFEMQLHLYQASQAGIYFQDGQLAWGSVLPFNREHAQQYNRSVNLLNKVITAPEFKERLELLVPDPRGGDDKSDLVIYPDLF